MSTTLYAPPLNPHSPPTPLCTLTSSPSSPSSLSLLDLLPFSLTITTYSKDVFHTHPSHLPPNPTDPNPNITWSTLLPTSLPSSPSSLPSFLLYLTARSKAAMCEFTGVTVGRAWLILPPQEGGREVVVGWRRRSSPVERVSGRLGSVLLPLLLFSCDSCLFPSFPLLLLLHFLLTQLLSRSPPPSLSLSFPLSLLPSLSPSLSLSFPLSLLQPPPPPPPVHAPLPAAAPAPSSPLSSSKPPPSPSRAPQQPAVAATAVAATGGGGFLANLLNRVESTSASLARVPKSQLGFLDSSSSSSSSPPPPLAASITVSKTSGASDGKVEVFRATVERTLTAFLSDPSSPPEVRIKTDAASGGSTCDLLKYIIYELADELGDEKWVAYRETSEFADELDVVVYRSVGVTPPGVLELMGQGVSGRSIRSIYGSRCRSLPAHCFLLTF